MNLRRVALDFDKAIGQPDVLALAAAIEEVAGVEGVNVTASSENCDMYSRSAL
jgi:uncharacterized protein